MSSYTRQQLEDWLKTIDVKADRVLDVGGSQNPILGRTKSWDVKEYEILDLKQPHECKRKPTMICDIQEYPIGETENGCWETLVDTGLDPHKRFNIVFCIEVSEYWYNPLFALENIAKCLKDNGILYVSFHFIYPIHNPIDQDYLRYTPMGVEKLLEKTGFKILENKPRLASENNLFSAAYQVEQMRPAKNYNHNIIGSLIKAKKI